MLLDWVFLPGPERSRAAPSDGGGPGRAGFWNPPLADAAQTRPRRPTGVFVHIDAPRLVELEIKGYDRWDEFHSVCISPCDTEVPVDFSYRVGGDDVHSSRVFSFPTGATRQTRAVKPRSPAA